MNILKSSANWIKENTFDFNLGLSVIGTLVMIIIYNLLWTVNSPRQFIIVEHRTSDTLTTHRDPGSFFTGINGVHRWNWANTIWFSKHSDEGDKRDESIPLQYIDGAKGNQSGNMLYSFSYNMPDNLMVELQQKFRDQRNFEDRAIKPLLVDALRISASITSSEEAYTSKKKEVGYMGLDQLQNGIYKVIVVPDSIEDFTGEVDFRDVTKIVEEMGPDSIMHPVRTGKSLNNFHVKSLVFSLYETDFDPSVEKIIKEKLNTNMDRIISLANTQLQSKKNYLEEVKGQVKIKKQKYETKEENEVKLVKSEMVKDTLEIMSQAKVKVSKIRKIISGYEKKISELQGTKEYKIRQLNMNADRQLHPRLNTYAEIEKRKAYAYGEAKGIYPEIILGADKGNKSSDVESFLKTSIIKNLNDLKSLSPTKKGK